MEAVIQGGSSCLGHGRALWRWIASLALAWSLLFPAPPLPAQSSIYRSIANHFTYKGGGGFTSPVGGTGAIMNEGWNAGAGLGYRLNRRFSTLVEWQSIRTGMGSDLLRYNLIPSGSYRIWTVAVDPTYNYWYRGKFGGYVLGGGGYSHTRTNYTGPSNSAQCYTLCTCYRNCSNQVAQSPATYHTGSSQAMAGVGFGFTMKISNRRRYRLYTEARYEDLFENSRFPPYKNVGVVPLTVGIQW